MNVIITGSTGMVGEGVMRVCIDNPLVEKILIINRRSIGFTHSKVTEIVHPNFLDFSELEDEFKHFDACFHCMGITSVGVDHEYYKVITYDMTMQIAKSMARANKNATFIYVSGGGTDHTETSRMFWARLKGKTENAIHKMGFSASYAYRPGFIKPYAGQQRAHKFYNYVNWMFPLGRILYPDAFNTMEELGLSMIQLVKQPIPDKIITGKKIAELAARK